MLYPITVAMPIGPMPHHVTYLDEAVKSVAEEEAGELLLIDDMHGLDQEKLEEILSPESFDYYRKHGRIWYSPWRLGVGHAFNFGVSLAKYDRIFMMGADDKLIQSCLSNCLGSWKEHNRTDNYYYVGVQYSDGREDQYLPCNAAMTTKGFWKHTGGFPIESSSGAPDAALMSIMLGNRAAGMGYLVNGTNPLYWYRVHDKSDTADRAPWQSVILETRNIVTALWKQPTWGRMAAI